jgi:hypothetical protein
MKKDEAVGNKKKVQVCLPKHNYKLDKNLLTVEPRAVDPHCFDVDPEPDLDPAQNLDADPDPDPGGRSAKNVHPPWQNPRYAPACDNGTGEQLSPVTTTPAIHLLPVSRTRTPWRWGAAKERRKLKGINRRSLRPPKSATAADGVIGTAMKSCIQKHPTHLDQRPLRLPKGALARFYGCSNDNIGGRR